MIPSFTVKDVGQIAEAALEGARCGRVAAVFARSFYIETDCGAFVCIGPESLGAGPLNVRCSSCDGDSARLRENAPVKFLDGAFTAERVGRFVYRQARRWMPPVPPPWTGRSLHDGIAALENLAKPPAEGLGRLGLGSRSGIGHGNSVLERGAAAADAVDEAVANLLRKNQPADIPAVELLLGLGPGLTPSGDDYLAGTMVALDLLGNAAGRDIVWKSIRARMHKLTAAISRAHLRAAAAGAAADSLHLLLNSILANQADQYPDRIAVVDAVGHTSGWDALAGALRVLRLWLSTRDEYWGLNQAAAASAKTTFRSVRYPRRLQTT